MSERQDGLVKVTVLLTPGAWAVCEGRAAVNGDTKTDTINRAIQVYNLVERIFDAGGRGARLLRKAGVRYKR